MLTCALALSLAPQDNYPRLGISGSVRNVWDPQDLQTAAKLECVFVDSHGCVKQVWIQPCCGGGGLCWGRQGARVSPLQHVGAVEKIQ